MPNPLENWTRDKAEELAPKRAVPRIMEESTKNIEATLTERGARYGAFDKHAEITQALKREMRKAKNWFGLDDDMIEALEMIQHKIGRILNGDPNYADSWVDIAGYAKLVADRLEKK